MVAKSGSMNDSFKKAVGFNPCSGGLWLLRAIDYAVRNNPNYVSILVLVDYGC